MTEDSGIDLLISTNLEGIEFFELVESLRNALKKKVEVLPVEALKDDLNTIDDVLRNGIKLF